MRYEQNIESALLSVLNTHPTWEALLESTRYMKDGHLGKYKYDTLPIRYKTTARSINRNDCKYLEAVPFKNHCFCLRLKFEKIIFAKDCANCKHYFPNPKDPQPMG